MVAFVIIAVVAAGRWPEGSGLRCFEYAYDLQRVPQFAHGWHSQNGEDWILLPTLLNAAGEL